MKSKTVPLSIGAVLIAASAMVCLSGPRALAADAAKAGQQAMQIKPNTVKFYARKYGDWLYRCETAEQNDKKMIKICQVSQSIVLQQDGHMLPLAELAFTKAQDQSGYDFSAAVPLGIFLPPGVGFAADKNTPVTLPVSFCKADSCIVTPSLQNELVKSFKTGTGGRIMMTAENGRKIVINLPLKGFSEALDALDSGRLPPEVKPEAHAH